MFFGKSRKRKSWHVGTPEYDQYEESDNRQDMYDLQKRMREHGFEGGPGINKDRWIYKDNIFDIKRPGGPGAEIWDMSDEDYEELTALLDKLDLARQYQGHQSNPTGIENPADYIGKVTIEKDTDNDGDLDTKVTEYK